MFSFLWSCMVLSVKVGIGSFLWGAAFLVATVSIGYLLFGGGAFLEMAKKKFQKK